MIYFTQKFQAIAFRVFALTVVLAGSTLPATANWSQQQRITSTPRGVGAQHGNAVAISGDTMVVGARFDSTTASQAGAAFVYVLSGRTWTQQAVLLAGDGAIADKFGYSVAISGDTIVVGSYNDDAPLSNGGSAYVFVRSGTTWTFQQKLTASDGTVDDEFGNAVEIFDTIDGMTVVAGAHFADLPGNSQAGSAYVFRRSGTVWTETQKLVPVAQVTLGDHFGESVAVGDFLAIGASGDDTPETAAGAVYVFGVAKSSSTFELVEKLTIGSGTNGDRFGCSVAMEGITLVAGAREDAPAVGQTARGSAYVFAFNGFTFSSQGQLLADDGAAFDRFGWSVAIYDDVIAVGAREDDTTVGPDAGSAYIFERNGLTWSQTQKLAPGDPFNGDRFGSSVALRDGKLVVGAAEKALTNPNGQGAAYYYTLQTPNAEFDYDADGRTDFSVVRPPGTWYLQKSTEGFFGMQWGIGTDKITPADFDGDGKTDIAVYRPSAGGWYVANSRDGTYSSYLFGLAEDIPAPADYDGDGRADICVFRPSAGTWYLQRSSNGAYFAYQFGAANDKPTVGDFDGDGLSDFAVFRTTNGEWYQTYSSDNSIHGEQFGFGTDKLAYADYDGDGKTDLAVFRPEDRIFYIRNSQTATYSAYFFGVGTDIPTPGDYDGDGKADLSVFRPSDGHWYRLNSGNGSFEAYQFGVNGDRPTPTAYH